MELAGLVQQMANEGRFARIARDPLAQFGTDQRAYLGAEILPEQDQEQNEYTEEDISYQTFVGNAATRYSPVQIKEGVMYGTAQVRLADSDVGSRFTGKHYDTLIRLLQRAGQGGDPPTMEAMSRIVGWVQSTLNLPLVELNEVYRWQALVDAQVLRTGDGGFAETVNFSAPTGHRPNAGGQWSSNAYDPFTDLTAAKTFLSNKGYTISRIFAGTQVISYLLGNTNMRDRVGTVTVAAGTVVGRPGTLTLGALNGIMQANGFPNIEPYDLTYKVQTAAGGSATHFLKRNVMVFVCQTGRNTEIEVANQENILLPDTLGYVGVGRPVGQTGPGRVIKTRVVDDSKPPRIQGEAWQTSFPVIQDPEAVYVIKAIS